MDEIFKILEKSIEHGERNLGNGTRLIGHATHVAPEDYDLPGNGANQTMGVFRVTDGPEQKNGKRYANGGDSYVAVIEFSNPPRARSLLSWGNATQAGSKHIGDQLQLYSRKELKEVWRLRKDVEANVAHHEVLK